MQAALSHITDTSDTKEKQKIQFLAMDLHPRQRHILHYGFEQAGKGLLL